VKIWSNESGQLIYTVEQHTDIVQAVTFYDGDKAVISGGISKQILISPIDGSKSESINSIRVGSLKVDYNERLLYIVEAAGKKVICYNIPNKEEVYRIEARENILSSALSLDKRYLLLNVSFVYPELQLWDLEARQVIRRYTGHAQERYYIKGIFGGHDQFFVASGSEDAIIYIWNKNTEVLVNKLPGHTSIVNCIAWSPTDPSLLVSGSDDYTVKVWDSKNWKVEVINDMSVKEDAERNPDMEDMEDND
jgi:WD40 repeat protein